jgi:rhamnosyltransferase
MEHQMRSASILIRTKNEARSLGATLEAVFSQSVPPHEVLVIDSGSRDRTLEIAARYPVKIIKLSPKGWSYPRALNIGAREATGEFIVCLSAHCPPARTDWLATLLRHFDDPKVAAAWGPNHYRGSALPPPEPPIRQDPGSYSFANRKWGMANCNSVLRRSLWKEIPFDESLPATEDKAWGRDVMNRGYSLVYDPAAGVWHERHSAANSFRRSRAIRAGYEAMFPGQGEPILSEARELGQLVLQKLILHVRGQSVSDLRHEVRMLPSALASLLGRIIHR